MRQEFQTHTLNDGGIEKTKQVGEVFSQALDALEQLVPQGRERSLVITKLQEAKHFAVRGVAVDPVNQVA
jgi:hypothetical protein